MTTRTTFHSHQVNFASRNRVKSRVRGNRGLYVDPGGKDSEAGTFVLRSDGENSSVDRFV
jgi:hypothetical protein